MLPGRSFAGSMSFNVVPWYVQDFVPYVNSQMRMSWVPLVPVSLVPLQEYPVPQFVPYHTCMRSWPEASFNVIFGL